jgi:hypothetical protein
MALDALMHFLQVASPLKSLVSITLGLSVISDPQKVTSPSDDQWTGPYSVSSLRQRDTVYILGAGGFIGASNPTLKQSAAIVPLCLFDFICAPA